MSRKLLKLFGFFVGLPLLAAIGYGAWQLMIAFVSAITAASSEVTAAIVGSMATILVGIGVVLLGQAHEKKRSREEAHRLKKIEIYQGFIDMISRMIGATNENLDIKGPEMPELTAYLFKYKSELLLWGSPRVIKSQINFESESSSGNTKKLFRAVNEMYLAIREDIGLSNSGLSDLELVKLYLDKNARNLLG